MEHTQKSRVLIVEDDKETAKKFKRALSQICDANIVEHVDQVFRNLLDFKPQVILLDIVLEWERPGTSWDAGINILEKLKEREISCHIPVVVITGRDDPEVKERCEELGAAKFFKKPVSIHELRQAVKDVLKLSQNDIE
jgi:CheY-like chemotaxis protein